MRMRSLLLPLLVTVGLLEVPSIEAFIGRLDSAPK